MREHEFSTPDGNKTYCRTCGCTREAGNHQVSMCECGHPFDPHILVPYNSPIDGGLMFCQELETCPCVRTWDVPQAGKLNRELPAPAVVQWYRQALILEEKLR